MQSGDRVRGAGKDASLPRLHCAPTNARLSSALPACERAIEQRAALSRLEAYSLAGTAIALPSGTTRIKPSCVVLATSTPSRVKNCPRARPRAPCAVGLSSEYNSQSSVRNGRWNHSA